MALVGTTFQPDAGEDYRKRLNRQNQFGPMSNEALKVLSMRLPQILGGRPPAPADLLRPRVGGAALLASQLNPSASSSPLAQLMDVIGRALSPVGGGPGGAPSGAPSPSSSQAPPGAPSAPAPSFDFIRPIPPGAPVPPRDTPRPSLPSYPEPDSSPGPYVPPTTGRVPTRGPRGY